MRPCQCHCQGRLSSTTVLRALSVPRQLRGPFRWVMGHGARGASFGVRPICSTGHVGRWVRLSKGTCENPFCEGNAKMVSKEGARCGTGEGVRGALPHSTAHRVDCTGPHQPLRHSPCTSMDGGGLGYHEAGGGAPHRRTCRICRTTLRWCAAKTGHTTHTAPSPSGGVRAHSTRRCLYPTSLCGRTP